MTKVGEQTLALLTDAPAIQACLDSSHPRRGLFPHL